MHFNGEQATYFFPPEPVSSPGRAFSGELSKLRGEDHSALLCVVSGLSCGVLVEDQSLLFPLALNLTLLMPPYQTTASNVDGTNCVKAHPLSKRDGRTASEGAL